MKKTLIATAVAAVIAAPAAMADITLGGQLQAEIVSASGDGVKEGEGLYLSDGWEGGKQNSGNSSAFFVKGNHDIGNGLTGLYKLNFNPKFGDNFSEVGTRDAFIGLKGGFGTVLLGRLNTPYKSSTVKWDPFLATFMQARGNGGMSGGPGGAGHNGYLGNVVAYANKFGPATFVGAIGFDESNDNPADGDADNDHAISASLNVPIGPVEFALAYVDTAGVIGADGTDNIEAKKVGLKYGGGDVSPLTLAAHYEIVEVSVPQGDASKDFNQIYLTGGYQFGANTVSLGLGITQSDADKNAAGEEIDDGEYIALGLNHAFNKSVSALVGYTTSDPSSAGSAKDDYDLVGVSMRVKF